MIYNNYLPVFKANLSCFVVYRRSAIFERRTSGTDRTVGVHERGVPIINGGNRCILCTWV